MLSPNSRQAGDSETFHNFDKIISATTQIRWLSALKHHYFSTLWKAVSTNNTATLLVRHYSWLSALKHHYFSTLWKAVSTIGTATLLVRTFDTNDF
ncbi:hypothetical protein QUC31_002484 [Theobroma cacao]